MSEERIVWDTLCLDYRMDCLKETGSSVEEEPRITKEMNRCLFGNNVLTCVATFHQHPRQSQPRHFLIVDYQDCERVFIWTQLSLSVLFHRPFTVLHYNSKGWILEAIPIDSRNEKNNKSHIHFIFHCIHETSRVMCVAPAEFSWPDGLRQRRYALDEPIHRDEFAQPRNGNLGYEKNDPKNLAIRWKILLDLAKCWSSNTYGRAVVSRGEEGYHEIMALWRPYILALASCRDLSCPESPEFHGQFISYTS